MRPGVTLVTIPDPPQPDDVVEYVLVQLLGPNSIIVWIFVFLNFGFAWYKVAQIAHQRARRVVHYASSIPLSGRLATASALMAMIVVHAVYLFVSYFIGVELSVMLEQQSGVQIYEYERWWQIPTYAQWDAVSGVYFGVAALIVIISIYFASRGLSLPGFLWYLPAVGLLCVGLLGLAWIGVVVGDRIGRPNYPTSIAAYPIVMTVIVGYLVVFAVGVNVPKIVFRTWRNSVASSAGEGKS